jgi:hypothetical protein
MWIAFLEGSILKIVLYLEKLGDIYSFIFFSFCYTYTDAGRLSVTTIKRYLNRFNLTPLLCKNSVLNKA